MSYKDMTLPEMIAMNLKGEPDAIEKYYPLRDALREAGDEEGALLVEEIIADEKNHINLLQVIQMKHDGNIKIAADKMRETFDFLKDNLTAQ